ncbi:hypothetical protein F5B21DRAFT_484944 [Xylaria acuta]|nr:hypothetical protein F5B21DRAFT_484944 [Xylaria acuta]
MPRPDSSDCLSKLKSGSGVVKPQARERALQFACDRCKGQKLRCIRTPKQDAPCERCRKAGATCVIDSSVRMGRPKRTDKEQRETTSSSYKPSQLTHSPISPTSSQAASKNFTMNGNIWLGHDVGDAVDPSLGVVQYLEPLDYGPQDAAALQDDLLYKTPSDDCFGHSLDFSTPFISNEDAAINTTAVSIHNYPPPVQQESVQKMSNLNLELYRQLGVIRPMASEYRSIETSLVESPDKNKSLSDAIVFMMQGLQTFHELLLGILGSADENFCKEATTHGAMWSSRDGGKPCSTSLLSLTEGREDDELRQSMYEATNWKEVKGSRSDNGAEPHIQESLPSSSFLDMPTSLLIISCYTNLIHLCRDVFAAIREALPATGHQKTPFTLSVFYISGVSIHQDSNLQILVLTQTVVRLVDKIGHSLSPHDFAAKSSKRDEIEAYSKTIPPQLLDFVLRQDGTGREAVYKVGIKALREEIRRLNELVYTPV